MTNESTRATTAPAEPTVKPWRERLDAGIRFCPSMSEMIPAMEAEIADWRAAVPVPDSTGRLIQIGQAVLDWNRAQKPAPIAIGKEYFVAEEVAKILAVREPAPVARDLPKPVDENKLGVLVAWYLAGKLPDDLMFNVQVTAEVLRRALGSPGVARYLSVEADSIAADPEFGSLMHEVRAYGTGINELTAAAHMAVVSFIDEKIRAARGSGDKANSAPPANSVNAVLDAARKLVKAKGRYHTEQNYKALMEATHAHDKLAAALSSMDGAAGTHTKESTK